MPTRVEVGLIGDPANPGGELAEAEWTKPWEERLRVELEVGDNETLATIADRALAEVGVEREGASVFIDVAVYEEPQQGLRSALVNNAVVDEDGKVMWNVDERNITYAHFVRSIQAGAVQADPRRLHVILREPIGDGLGIDWATAVEAWIVIWAIADRIAAAGGAVQAIRAVLERLTCGRATAEKHMHRWAQRGTYPGHFARWLHRDTWSAETLTGLLGCPQEEAEAILALFGFAYSDEDGLWHRGGDDAGRLLEAAYDEAGWLNIDTEESRAELESRVEEMFRTGELPPERTFEPAEREDFPAPLEIVSLTVTPSGVVGHGRFGGRDIQFQVPAEEMAPEQVNDFSEVILIAYRFIQREIARLGKDAERWSSGGDGAAD